MKQLFIAWTTYIRRPESMKSHFQYELVFMRPFFTRKFLKPLNYLIHSVHTSLLLMHKRPKVLWVQIAPTPLLYLAALYKLFNRRAVVVADCHNSMYHPPWIIFPWAIALLNYCNIVLVHNDMMYKKALRFGIRKEKLFILETRPAQLGIEQQYEQGFKGATIVMPCSFDSDEPIETVFEAARLIPKINIIITGNTNRAIGKHSLIDAPNNVTLTGFLPKSKYDRLLHSVDAVMGLTTSGDVQLSAANEAVGAGKPMVLSNTPLLRRLFYKGAVYVDALNPNSIAAGCQEVIEQKEILAAQVQLLNNERCEKWLLQAKNIFTSIGITI